MKVILMLKAPRPGTVKTRLAKDLGYERATEIYRKLVEHQIAQLPPEFDVEIYFAPVDAEQEMKGWLGNKFQFHPQSEGNLGDRLSASANEVFNNQTDGLIFLGGDCPHLTTEILMKCKRQMENHEVVIGPACDGGYYLIGIKKPWPQLFEGIDWGTERVQEQTLFRIRENALNYFLLPELEDVDDLASWERAKRLIKCPTTA